MRIERIRRGVEVRVIYNRGELREHCRRALLPLGRVPPELVKTPVKEAPLFVGPSDYRLPEGIKTGLVVTNAFLQDVCRRMAAARIEIPEGATFTVGIAEDGTCSGATFLWFEPNATES